VQERTGRTSQHRTLRSDLLLVRYPDTSEWHVFRDVYEVDGHAVRGAGEQLLELFLRPGPDALERARELARTSAKYHIKDVGTVNNPLLAISILQPRYRDRFRFNVRGIARSLGATVRTVDFEETERPTILRQGANADLPSRGVLAVDEATGRVVRTELRLGQRFTSTIVVTFGTDPALGIDVPLEMRDRYPVPAPAGRVLSGGVGARPTEREALSNAQDGEIRGVATYSRFRRFRVTTEEVIRKPPLRR
jgi:hypothetical protein